MTMTSEQYKGLLVKKRVGAMAALMWTRPVFPPTQRVEHMVDGTEVILAFLWCFENSHCGDKRIIKVPGLYTR